MRLIDDPKKLDHGFGCVKTFASGCRVSRRPQFEPILGLHDQLLARQAAKDDLAPQSALSSSKHAQKADQNEPTSATPTVPGSAESNGRPTGPDTAEARPEAQPKSAAALQTGEQADPIAVLSDTKKPYSLSGEYVIPEGKRLEIEAGVTITFIQTPMGWPGDYNPLAGGDMKGQFRTNVLAVKEWVPALKVGSDLVQQHGITENGDLDLKPNLDSMAGAGKSAGGAAKSVSDILGGMDAASPTTPPPPTGVFTAEWIEYAVTGPGIKSRTERRTIFDLIGDAARTSAAKPISLTDDQRLDRGVGLSASAQLLPLTCQLSLDFVQHLAISNLVDNQAAMSGSLRTAASDSKKSWDQLVTINPFPGQLLTWALARSAVSRSGSSMFFNQLNVVTLRNEIRRSATNEYSQRLTLDIVANPVAFAASAGDPFSAAVEQGVLDTNIETAVMPTETTYLKTHFGTADLMNQAKVQGVNWATIKPNSAKPDWNAANVQSDAQAMMSKELAEGYLVFAPDKPVSINSIPEFGWWRIDPVTGQSLGMTTAGGSAMVERALLFVVFLATWANNVMGCGGFAAGASSGKKLGCAVCGGVSAAISTLALGAAFGVGGLSVAGKVASGAAGAAGSSVTGSICNGISAGMD